jgi:hypothetical protein
VTGLEAVKQLIKTAKGATGKKKKRYRSLREGEILGIDDLVRKNFLALKKTFSEMSLEKLMSTNPCESVKSVSSVCLSQNRLEGGLR